jgi:hypothetical protein
MLQRRCGIPLLEEELLKPGFYPSLLFPTRFTSRFTYSVVGHAVGGKRLLGWLSCQPLGCFANKGIIC